MGIRGFAGRPPRREKSRTLQKFRRFQVRIPVTLRTTDVPRYFMPAPARVQVRSNAVGERCQITLCSSGVLPVDLAPTQKSASGHLSLPSH